MEEKRQLIDSNRLFQTIEQSAEIGKIPGDGLCRLALTEEDKRMRDMFRGWMEEAGLETRIDDFGNMYGRRKGQQDLPPIVIGSHLDTQPNGGRFDGILGVLASLEVMRTLNDHHIDTVRPIEVMNFTNEEGARFEPPLLGSGGITEVFSPEFIYSRTDKAGNTFGEELRKIGYLGDKANRLKEVHSFLELHIEQGPILEKESISIGAVEGIKGMTWLEFTVTGESGHAGPTPMDLRKDALMAAAKLIVTIEQRARAFDPDVSVTVGRMTVSPNVVNSIPKQIIFSLDIRHQVDEVRTTLIKELEKETMEICRGIGVQLEIKELWNVEATVFDEELVNLVAGRAEQLGYSVKKMVSGAGHDAKYMTLLAPTVMIFVPSAGGKSHTESEFTNGGDLEKGANVLLQSVLDLANRSQERVLLTESGGVV